MGGEGERGGGKGEERGWIDDGGWKGRGRESVKVEGRGGCRKKGEGERGGGKERRKRKRKSETYDKKRKKESVNRQ